jgi:hypothetical protein
MISRTDIPRVLLAFASLYLVACNESSEGGAGTGGSQAEDSSSAGGQGAEGGGGSATSTGSQGGSGACVPPPSDGTCEALSTVDVCKAEGCEWVVVLSKVTITETGDCDYEDSSMCLPLNSCVPQDRASGYFKGEEVIELTAGCALAGWTPCGTDGAPAACECIEQNVICE